MNNHRAAGRVIFFCTKCNETDSCDVFVPDEALAKSADHEAFMEAERQAVKRELIAQHVCGSAKPQ